MRSSLAACTAGLFASLILAALAAAQYPPGGGGPGQWGGLVGHWTLDGNTLDSSGNGCNGTAYGTPAFVSADLRGGDCLRFTPVVGSPDYVDVGLCPTIDGSFALSAWVRTTSPGWITIAGQTDYNDGNGLNDPVHAFLLEGIPELRVDDGSRQYELRGTYRIDDGRWHHVAFALDTAAGKMSLYLDGQLGATGPGPSSVYLTTDVPLLLGAAPWNTYTPGSSDVDAPFEGDLREVVLFDRDLAPAEVDWLYRYGQVGHWTELVTGTVPDRSGFGNTGTPYLGVYDCAGPCGFPALGFDPAGPSHVYVPPSSSLDLDAAFMPGFTILAWVNTASDSWQTLLAKTIYNDGNGTNDPVHAFVSAGLPELRIDDGSTQWALTGTTRVDDGAWHHLAFVVDFVKGQMTLYLDGVLHATGAGPSSIYPNSDLPVVLGAAPWSTYTPGSTALDAPFDGCMSDVYLLPFAFSEGEVDMLHEDGAGASWMRYGRGVAGTLGVPGIGINPDPVLGTTPGLWVDNSLGAPTTGLLFVGLAPASIPAGCGELLVVPVTWLVGTVPVTGWKLPLPLTDPALFCGLHVYLQAWLLDPGACGGIAMTPGLDLKPGL